MTYNTFYNLCNNVAQAVEQAVSGLIGQPDAGVTLRIGADGTPTEKIDEAAENAALSVLEEDGRSIRFVSEELGEKIIGKEPEFTFVLDPVDGTFNAVNNIPFFCVPIAIGDSNLSDIIYGYVRNLVNKDIYTAKRGKGAFLNGKRIHVSSHSSLSELGIISYSYNPHTYPTNIKRIRAFGSAALELCYVACGIFDTFIDMRGMLRITDIAAGKLIVEEAGGRITDAQGLPLSTPLDVKQRVKIVASNGSIHDKLLEYL